MSTLSGTLSNHPKGTTKNNPGQKGKNGRTWLSHMWQVYWMNSEESSETQNSSEFQTGCYGKFYEMLWQVLCSKDFLHGHL